MKKGIISTTALCCAALIGCAIPCMATETPTITESYTQKIQQEEAIIVRIDQNNVTLQSISDKSKIMTISSNNAADFKIGEKVTVVGNTLKKFESAPAATAKPGDSSSSSKTPASDNKL
ncbi:MAG: hypothetical protein HXX11_19480 [Desulfuromonadales bacterium]|nr:hypothetical protein [Desulfuromonadales bacterium]